MNAEELTPKIISDFIIEVREESGLKAFEEAVFMQMLQIGLNRLADDGALKFAHDKMLYRKYAASNSRISYITNPYTEEETKKIQEWAETHLASVPSQATALWFTKGLTLEDIVNLTKKDCWGEGCIERAGRRLFQAPARTEIVRRALDTHPPKIEHVFSVPNPDGTGWRKLTERGLLINLKHICKNIGIEYKLILVNEAIKLN